MEEQEAKSLPDIDAVIVDLQKRGLPLVDFEFLSMQPSREESENGSLITLLKKYICMWEENLSDFKWLL